MTNPRDRCWACDPVSDKRRQYLVHCGSPDSPKLPVSLTKVRVALHNYVLLHSNACQQLTAFSVVQAIVRVYNVLIPCCRARHPTSVKSTRSTQ